MEKTQTNNDQSLVLVLTENHFTSLLNIVARADANGLAEAQQLVVLDQVLRNSIKRMADFKKSIIDEYERDLPTAAPTETKDSKPEKDK